MAVLDKWVILWLFLKAKDVDFLKIMLFLYNCFKYCPCNIIISNHWIIMWLTMYYKDIVAIWLNIYFWLLTCILLVLIFNFELYYQSKFINNYLFSIVFNLFSFKLTLLLEFNSLEFSQYHNLFKCCDYVLLL